MKLKTALKMVGYKLLYGGSRRLREHERECIAAYLELLPCPTRQQVESQLVLCDFVYRNKKGRFVLLQHMEKEVPPELLFPNREIELAVAVVTLKQGRESLKAKVYFEEGALVGLKFSKPPLPFVRDPYKVASVKVLVDVSVPPPQARLEAPPPGTPLGDVAARVPILDIRPGASPESIQALRERIPGKLPTHLTKLLQTTDGFAFPGGVFEGTRGKEMPYPDETVFVLAENEGQTLALCLTDSEERRGLQLLDEIAEEFTPLPNNAVEAFVRFYEACKNAEKPGGTPE